MIDELVSALFATRDERATAARPTLRLQWLSRASDEEVLELLTRVHDLLPRARVQEGLLSAVFRELCGRMRQSSGARISPRLLTVAGLLYRALGAASQARCHLLQMLALSHEPTALKAFAALVAEDPPQDRSAVGLAFSPLFQSKCYDPSALFPQLLVAIGHPAVAAPIIDLCNFLTREGLVARHPATQRAAQFSRLLGDLVHRLAVIEQQVGQEQSPPQITAAQVDDSVSLAVALCDALALIGDPSAVGKLYQALDLAHRRLRTEAAAALARLGEEAGREALVALAAEPVCRLRVLAYAQELDLLERCAAQYQTPTARAEAELALWLAQPTQMGIPPTRLELLDSRRQYWPGYEEPVECFLFRFVYQFAEAQYTNIGIAGPLAHAFPADLADLPPADIYAAFAGWDVQHEEIFDVDYGDLAGGELVEAQRLQRRLQDAGYEDIRPLQVSHFLGERLLIAHATFEGSPGIVVADSQDVVWHPSRGSSRPIGALEAGCIAKGRRMLRTFNEGDLDGSASR